MKQYTTHEETAMKLLWEGDLVGTKRAHIAALILKTAHHYKEKGFTVDDLIIVSKETPNAPTVENSHLSHQLSKINPVTRQALNDLRKLGFIHKNKHHYYLVPPVDQEQSKTQANHKIN